MDLDRDLLQQATAERTNSVATIRAEGYWTRHFNLFHAKQHPGKLSNADIGCFL